MTDKKEMIRRGSRAAFVGGEMALWSSACMEGPSTRNGGSQEWQSQPPTTEQRGLAGRTAYPLLIILGWGPKLAIGYSKVLSLH